jgi:hypothetical protein
VRRTRPTVSYRHTKRVTGGASADDAGAQLGGQLYVLGRPNSSSGRAADELRRLVERSPRIRAIGARHSFNGVADSPGDLVDLGDIDPDFLIDPERRTVTVGGRDTLR